MAGSERRHCEQRKLKTAPPDLFSRVFSEIPEEQRHRLDVHWPMISRSLTRERVVESCHSPQLPERDRLGSLISGTFLTGPCYDRTLWLRSDETDQTGAKKICVKKETRGGSFCVRLILSAEANVARTRI